MSKSLHTEIDIDARPERVWAVLVDFSAYRDWNPFIISADGRAEANTRLTLRMRPVDGRAMTIRPTVLDVEPGRRLRWHGRLVVPGVFDGEHVFTLEPRTDGGTTLVQSEKFGGVLVPFVARSLDRGTLPGFHAMNEALKERVERTVAQRHG